MIRSSQSVMAEVAAPASVAAAAAEPVVAAGDADSDKRKADGYEHQFRIHTSHSLCCVHRITPLTVRSCSSCCDVMCFDLSAVRLHRARRNVRKRRVKSQPHQLQRLRKRLRKLQRLNRLHPLRWILTPRQKQRRQRPRNQ